MAWTLCVFGPKLDLWHRKSSYSANLSRVPPVLQGPSSQKLSSAKIPMQCWRDFKKIISEP